MFPFGVLIPQLSATIDITGVLSEAQIKVLQWRVLTTLSDLEYTFTVM